MRQRKCLQCDKTFDYKPNKKYCSRKCCKARHNDQQREAGWPAKTKWRNNSPTLKIYIKNRKRKNIKKEYEKKLPEIQAFHRKLRKQASQFEKPLQKK